MSLIWLRVVPVLLAALALFAFWMAKRLQFFSRAARGLDQIDIPNEVSEIRINELEMLVGGEADFYFMKAGKLTPGERRRAVTRRLLEARKWLHLIISNAALFQEIARFRIQQAGSAENEQDLAFRIMDRAASVHLIAATCLAKLLLIDLCRLCWPLYMPLLADRFQLRSHDLVAWYRHLVKEMLAFAQDHYDGLTYNRFIFQLTGLFSVEEAARLNRL